MSDIIVQDLGVLITIAAWRSGLRLCWKKTRNVNEGNYGTEMGMSSNLAKVIFTHHSRDLSISGRM